MRPVQMARMGFARSPNPSDRLCAVSRIVCASASAFQSASFVCANFSPRQGSACDGSLRCASSHAFCALASDRGRVGGWR